MDNKYVSLLIFFFSLFSFLLDLQSSKQLSPLETFVDTDRVIPCLPLLFFMLELTMSTL